MMSKIDLAIIGAGPAGYVAAERAGAKGLSVVMFEKRELGGVCLNEGCMPTKTLLYSAKIYDTARDADKYGVTVSDVTFDFKKIVARKDRVVRRLVGGVGAKMRANNVTVVKEKAVVQGRSEKGVEILAGGEIYFALNLLICTGSEAFVPPIPGVKEAGDIIVTNREILSQTKLPESLVVIGGGVVGMEFASYYNSLGTKVTVVEMMPEILGASMDSELSVMLRSEYTGRGVEFNLSCQVTQIEGNKVIYRDAEGKEGSVEGEQILMSVGRRPNVEGLGLENIGVEVERGAIKVDNRMRTNVPNVYAAGDVTGFSMLAHTASREGEVVVNNLTGRKDVMRYNAIPGVIYTTPELASVGYTEEQAKKEGIAYRVSKLPMAYAGRFMVENERGSGLCKILVGEEYGEVIGVHLIGNPSSEMIFGACMAIEQEMTLEQLQEVVFPHPTVSEIIKETIFSF